MIKKPFASVATGILFWVGSFTWGAITSLAGLIVAVTMLITGHKPKIFKFCVYFEVGFSWGGFSLGAFIFVNKNPSSSLLRHEIGHGIENIIFGIFFPFLVAIPSTIRYWYREFLVKHKNKKYSDLPDYDAIWFESLATKIGRKYFL